MPSVKVRILIYKLADNLLGHREQSIASIATIQHAIYRNQVQCYGVVSNQWTGLLDWTTGLDYWTDHFTTKIHF